MPSTKTTKQNGPHTKNYKRKETGLVNRLSLLKSSDENNIQHKPVNTKLGANPGHIQRHNRKQKRRLSDYG